MCGVADENKQTAAGETLLVCPELFAAEGGIARISRLYLRALRQAQPGHIRLVVLNDAALPPERLAPYGGPNLDGIGCARSKLAFFRAVLATGRLARPCRRALATHVHLLPALWLLTLLRRDFRYDVVLHGVEVWRPLPLTLRIALRRVRRAYCVSNYTRERVANLHPSLADRLRVLPNALDPDREFAGDTSGQTRPGRILALSRLAAHDAAKGIDHLIAALPAIRAARPSAHLVIAGDGNDRPRLENLARHSPAASAITFTGTVDNNHARALLASCQIFALPSNKEGFGLVFLEAMAAGKPCVGARAGGIPEVISDETGLLVPYGDVTALAAACVRALDHPWDADALRRRAQLFSSERFTEQFATLWNQP
ncbi:glycosyltransferase family 1 protein [Opitutaceae bacterium TAV4]|nr:glycosyltransferase family 1 protein [Opitutaceae bacterium TAV4]RRK00716.1 glycosyltransferase family 1 protein [Opitutaceae bacterium TAV3]